MPTAGQTVHMTDMYVYMVVEIIICIPTILGNILILVSIARFPRLRIRKNLLIANLAVSDLLVGTVLIPYDVVSIACTELADDKYFCLVELTLYVCLLGASVMNIFIISLERYLVIAYPLWHKKHFRTRCLYVIICAVWMTMFAMAVMPVFGLNTFAPEEPCSSDYVLLLGYKVALSIIVFMPCCVSFCMYAIVIKIAIGQYKKTVAHYRRRRTTVARRTIIMMAIFGIFVICWSPFTFLQLTSAFIEHTPSVYRLRKWFTLLGLLNSGINWMVYGLMNVQFRRAFGNIIRCQFHASFYRVSYLGANFQYLNDTTCADNGLKVDH